MATILTAGDIAFVGANAETNGEVTLDTIAFVLLVDVDGTTSISFTDHEFLAATGNFDLSSDADGVLTWTAPAGRLTAGTVVTININSDAAGNSATASPGSIDGGTAGGFALSSGGDQIFAFQGTINGDETVIAGINTSDVLYGITERARTDLPPGLTAGENAVATGLEIGFGLDNSAYIGPTTGTIEELRTAINTASNWTRDNDDTQLTFPTTFRVTTNNNTPPIVDLNGDGEGIDNAVAFDEATNQGLAETNGVLIASAGTLLDADLGDDVETITITLTNDSDGDLEQLFVPEAELVNGVTVTGNSSDTLILNRDGASEVDLQIALQSVLYQNGSDAPTMVSNSRTITVVANDGDLGSELATTTITIVPDDDLPTATGVPTDVVVTPGTATDIDLSSLEIMDPECFNLVLTLTASEGTFTAMSDGTVTITGSGTGTLMISAGNEAAINTYLDTITNIQYTSTPTASGNDAATITVNVADFENNPVVGTINVDVGIPETPGLVVTTTADVVDQFDNQTSLREALAFANSDADFSAITFADGLGEAFENGGVIRLTEGELVISSDVTIDGDLNDDGVADIVVSGDANNDDIMQEDDEQTAFDESLLSVAPDITGDETGGGEDGFATATNEGEGEDSLESRVFNIVDGNSTLTGLAITGGISGFNGAGVSIGTTASLDLVNVIVSGNTVTETGGGIGNFGTLAVSNSTISGNSALSLAGGIFSSGELMLNNVTLSGNEAGNDIADGITNNGGGIVNTGAATLNNVTLSGNNTIGSGGAIFNADSGTLTVNNATLSGNSAGDSGGGISNISAGAVMLNNTIVLGNAATNEGAEISGAVGGSNNITSGDVAEIFAATEVGADGVTQAGQLANNGGSVLTIGLNTDVTNPALDAGDDSLLDPSITTDARGTGFDRRVDIPGTENNGSNAIDLGAFELNISTSPTEGDDFLVGTPDVDVLRGLGGDDRIFGLDSNDILDGGAGADVLFGGGGLDTADYRTSSAGVIVDIAMNSATGGDAEGDSFVSIERVIGSTFADTLTGTAANDILRGEEGDDTLNGEIGNDRLLGQSGNDILNGGEGNDLLIGGSGGDTLTGGEGLDTAGYRSSTDGVTVNLAAGTGVGGDAEGDVLSGIERVFGSISDDTLIGDAQNNILLGVGGADTIDGGAGLDRIFGQQGDDTFVFKAGNDRDVIVDFTQGSDALDLSSFGFESDEQALDQAAQVGTSVVFNFGSGDVLILRNQILDNFDASDFILA